MDPAGHACKDLTFRRAHHGAKKIHGSSAYPFHPSATRFPLEVLMSVQQSIMQKLTEAFRPESLNVVDESHQHEGHAGHRPGGETHFRVFIVAPAFAGKSRLERHRMINAALAAELAGRVHALAIHAAAPGEGGI
jgi:BolA family transcriptional regulator, general stress-responsive regulator